MRVHLPNVCDPAKLPNVLPAFHPAPDTNLPFSTVPTVFLLELEHLTEFFCGDNVRKNRWSDIGTVLVS